MLLKKTPEDFIVTEIPVEFSGSGYTILKVTKRMLNSEDVAKLFARSFGVPRKFIGYAGTKDKCAVTTQYFSVKGVPAHKIEGFVYEGVSVDIVGSRSTPLSLGELLGNKFELVVRELEKPLIAKEIVPNYFGAQRFGRNNVAIGRAFIKKEFKKACELLELEVTNPIESIKTVPRHTLLLIVHAYQSWLWNELLKKLLANGSVVPEFLPLIGFGTDFDELDDTVRELCEEFLLQEGITPRDFIIRQLPGISPEGATRKAMIEVKDLVLGEFVDGVQKVSFTLPKGSYATVVVDALNI